MSGYDLRTVIFNLSDSATAEFQSKPIDRRSLPGALAKAWNSVERVGPMIDR